MLIATQEEQYDLDIDDIFEFTTGGPLLLIDADPIAYSSASACDKATHILSLNGSELFTVEGGITALYNHLSFKDYREFNKMLENNPDITYSKSVDSDDSGNMFHTIKAQVKKLIKRTGAGSVKLYLTDGATNFRVTENIATILKYKGNRSSDAKPKMLGKARDYMVDQLGAIMCVGYEADDLLAFEHRKAWSQAVQDAQLHFIDKDEPTQAELEEVAIDMSETILCTIDKDIKMVAGKFLNPDQDIGVERITSFGHVFLEEKAKSKKLRFCGYVGFMAQMLLGDATDNIPSLYNLGDVKAYEILKDCKTDEEAFKEMYREVHRSILRKHVSTLKEDVLIKVDKAVELGQVKDNKSARDRCRKKMTDKLLSIASYGDFQYVHWDEFVLKEDGTVSKELKDPENYLVNHLSPRQYITEVGRLLYMLDTLPNEAGDHLWVPDDKWCTSIENEFAIENLDRVETNWGALV